MTDGPVDGYRVRPAAEIDLDEIWDRSAAAWGLDQADDYIRDLARTFEILVDFPEIARERVEIDPPVRCHPHRAHLIVYRVEAPWLVILRVVHARRHWIALLEH